MATTKPVHTIVLDTGAIIKNHPTVSTLLAQSENLVTVPAIISEIRDAATRSRVETTLLPFLTLRSPNPNSIKFVSEFARRTGDLAVLSKPDIQIIALAYELECERNGGDWRLRKAPGQKGLNGSPPSKEDKSKQEEVKDEDAVKEAAEQTDGAEPSTEGVSLNEGQSENQIQEPAAEATTEVVSEAASEPTDATVEQVNDAMANTNLDAGLDSEKTDPAPEAPEAPEALSETVPETVTESQEDAEDLSDSDSDGWITPSNLKKHQAKDAAGVSLTAPTQTSTMQVGTLTTDFAMQNVILQINLNLLSPSMHRVKHLKTFILRCHACFQTTKQMDKQFCERCGKPTLTRVACSTDANGEFKLHLKKNMQWNTRGDKFSIPKAVHGSTNGRRNHGGGKGGWGTELILAEDQKEYMVAQTQQKRNKERDLMDEDYLPSILTGDRGRAGGRIKVGAGRNINSKKR